MAKRARGSQKRVYIVGAGASAGRGYPVGAQLLPTLVRRLAGVSGNWPAKGLGQFNNSLRCKPIYIQKAERILEALEEFSIRYFLNGRSEARSNGKVRWAELARHLARTNLSEFFSLSNALADTPDLFSSNIDHSARVADSLKEIEDTELFYRLSSVVRTLFIDISDGIATRPIFDKKGKITGHRQHVISDDIRNLVQNSDPQRDAFISFNWDEELDIELTSRKDCGIAYTRMTGAPRDDFLLLKPHGSIGWYDVAQGINNDEVSFITDGDQRLERSRRRVISFPRPELPRDLDGGQHHYFDCPPVITPPTYAKRFVYEEQRLIWQDVIDVCRDAEQFIFLGYSLPTDDFLTKAAIGGALSQKRDRRVKFLAVGMDGGVLRNYFELFGNAVSLKKNFVPWEFGSSNRHLSRAISAKIDKATVY